MVDVHKCTFHLFQTLNFHSIVANGCVCLSVCVSLINFWVFTIFLCCGIWFVAHFFLFLIEILLEHRHTQTHIARKPSKQTNTNVGWRGVLFIFAQISHSFSLNFKWSCCKEKINHKLYQIKREKKREQFVIKHFWIREFWNLNLSGAHAKSEHCLTNNFGFIRLE